MDPTIDPTTTDSSQTSTIDPVVVGDKIKSIYPTGVTSTGKSYATIDSAQLGSMYMMKHGTSAVTALGLDPNQANVIKQKQSEIAALSKGPKSVTHPGPLNGLPIIGNVGKTQTFQYYDPLTKTMQTADNYDEAMNNINNSLAQLGGKTLPTIPQVNKPAPNPFTQGVAGAVTDALPTIGSIGGSILGGAIGGLAGIETGPGAILTGIAGGAAGGATGGAGGESLKEALQGKNASVNDIKNQAVLGGMGGAIGGVAEPVLGGIGSILSKIPGVGAITDSLSNLADTQLNKIFGSGTADTVKELGLDKVVPSKLLPTAQAHLDAVGSQIGNVLTQADQLGASSPVEAVSKVISDATSSLGKTESGVNTLIEKATNLVKDAIEGQTDIPSSVTSSLKTQFADLAKYDAKTPTVDQQFFQKVANGMRDLTERSTNSVGVDIAGLNDQWAKVHDVVTGLTKTITKTTGGGGRGFGLGAILGPLRTPAGRLFSSNALRTAKYLPDIVSQMGIRSGQDQNTLPPIGQ